MREPENRAAMWQWLAPHFDAFRARLSPFAQSRVSRTFSEGRCSAADADEMSAFIAPRIAKLIGGERGLGQTLEGIRQCGALRDKVDRKALGEWVAGKGR